MFFAVQVTRTRKGMKKKRIWLLGGLIAVFTVSMIALRFGADTSAPEADIYIQSSRPTLFFHGYGSNYWAEKHMANAAKNQGAADTVIRADVSENGEVTLKGEIPEDARNPIVLVNYEKNRGADFEQVSEYAYNVVKALQDKYDITEMNMVGHSYGNMSIMFYMINHGTDTTLPKLVKQVNIAGAFNGVIGIDEPDDVRLDDNGKPSIMNETYRALLNVQETYPENQVDVLNIYGDTGNGGDGSVTVKSAKSLRYLISDVAKSYQEIEIDGSDGRHSKLHETSKVDDPLIKFLWGK